MNNGTDQSVCGCCREITEETPATVENRPGLPSLAWRVGEYGSFRNSMIAGLIDEPATASLGSEFEDDPAVALIDSWSVVLDVLSFYQERIANEGFLRTATERRSVLEMARSIGYELRPGVAASTYLAFTVETAPGTPEEITIAVGTAAQSIPGQDETPQTFETVEEITARTSWNEMTPEISTPQKTDAASDKIWLEGTATNLKGGDGALIFVKDADGEPTKDDPVFRTIGSVSPDRENNRTLVTLESPLGFTPDTGESIAFHALRQRASLFGYNAPDWKAMPASIQAAYEVNSDGEVVIATEKDDWPNLSISGTATVNASPYSDDNDLDDTYLYLDTTYPAITVGSWIVLSTPSTSQAFVVREAKEETRSAFTLSGKCTRLLISSGDPDFTKLVQPGTTATTASTASTLPLAHAATSPGSRFSTERINIISINERSFSNRFNTKIRQITVFGQNEELELAEEPVTDIIETPTGSDRELMLEGKYGDLLPGRLVALSGVDEAEEKWSEVVELLSVTERTEENRTGLLFASELQHRYTRESLKLNANVARATHGKSVSETLGSGDGAGEFQKFVLQHTPLTSISAPTVGGTESTLSIRVNGILWKEEPTLYGLSKTDQAYMVRHDDEGGTTVTFGNGRTGARLPTGEENVTAEYRTGTGLEGLVGQEQIALLMTRAYGLKNVVNPTAPTGADDPEMLADARSNAPMTVLTFDRIVSLRDYEDFARAFAGVAKASAVRLRLKGREVVHLSVAGPDGATIPTGSTLHTNLLASIDASRHADHRVLVDSFEPLGFHLEAELLVDSRYRSEEVFTRVAAVLNDHFSFANRSFAQPVTSGEVFQVIQNIEGVVAVDLDALYFCGDTSGLNSRLTPHPARYDAGTLFPAQLLSIATNGIKLTEMNG